ncbi:DUF1566 domain-containing protein [Hydrogenophaga sp. RWCD_12]|uniref:DUF1566 domain-containing protein n=1 Tax=Hydrogenophaga sp. RWCD_12 TaxID=3391190 RepID=UPI003985352C
MSFSVSLHRIPLCWLFVAFLSGLLVACGGGQSATAEDKGAAPVANGSALLAKGAALSSADLAAAEKRAVSADAMASPTSLDGLPAGQIAAKSAYASGAVARKALAVRIPVYRFYNGRTGAHFFTTNTTERDTVVATLSPPFSLEGAAFSVASAYSPGLSPVHRFFNTQTGVHFYTISEAERANVVATLPHFQYEGVAYHASQVAGQGLIPFYRFYVPSKGFHFYTASETEKNSIIANLAATYSFEGIGYYVLDSNWNAEKLPHTGLTSSQCYKEGGDALVTCAPTPLQTLLGPTSLTLNPNQDGHRASVNPMTYSLVGGNPTVNCVRDNVTGLVWEGKTAADDRAGSRTFTHLGNAQYADTSGYVTSVNETQLCGFSDWRIPTVLELQSLVNYSKNRSGGEPVIDSLFFPNTSAASYWSADFADANVGQSFDVSFQSGMVSTSPRTPAHARHLRLVRGSMAGGTRFSYSTVAYGSDAPNNLVNDALTGLQWRRCAEGMQWTGSACTGSASSFSHEAALAHANQSGWRMPNIKELNSLLDRSVFQAPRTDTTAFPQTPAQYFWSSTPDVYASEYAWSASVGSGVVSSSGARSGTNALRLVRSVP